MNGILTKPVVEETALARLETTGLQVRSCDEIAHGEPAAERDDYGQVVLTQPSRASLALLSYLDLGFRGVDACIGRAA